MVKTGYRELEAATLQETPIIPHTPMLTITNTSTLEKKHCIQIQYLRIAGKKSPKRQRYD